MNIIYHQFPHYRAPVMRALVQTGVHDYRFWGDTNDYAGIKAFKGDDIVRIHPLRFDFDEASGRMTIRQFWGAVTDPAANAIIIIGNANIRATWLIAIAARLRGKKVLFWAHGWLMPEPKLKAMLRNFYFGLAHKVLVYGQRALDLAVKSGFSGNRIAVIWNSLDWNNARMEIERLKGQPVALLRAKYDLPADARVLICTARLTQTCEFDVLLKAVALLRKTLPELQVLLVGDGPERGKLEALAAELKVPARFTGAIYDEAALAELFTLSDVTVSPGKVGLTAMHSFTYGVPVITHGDLDRQMPEVEAVTPGVTGAFFEKGDVADLAEVIAGWFACNHDGEAVRAACQEMIASRFNPYVQAQLIDAAVSEVLHEQPAHAV